MKTSRVLLVGGVLAASVLSGCSKSGDSDAGVSTNASSGASASVSTTIAPSTRAALSDADFAKSVYDGLSKNDSSVEADIDWDNLSAGGKDVGALYTKFQSPEEKASFRKSFLSSFASSQNNGAGAAAFSDWHETVKDEVPGQFIVLATAPNGKHLQITSNTVNGQRKVILIGVG